MSLDIDNTSLTLLAVLASLLIYHRFFSTPYPLVHPLLLGKQSDVSHVRKKNETGVYRSFATGQGSPFQVRPTNGLKTVNDIFSSSKGPENDVTRCILDAPLSDESLKEIVHLLPRGLRSLFPALNSNDKSIITLLPPSPSTALPLLLLELGAVSPLIILPDPVYFTMALTTTSHPSPAVAVVHVDLLEDVVEQVLEDKHGETGVLVIGDPQRKRNDIVQAAGVKGMTVRFWEELWDVAETANMDISQPNYSDVHSIFYSKDPHGIVKSKVTHINITAGIAGLLSIFPADKRPSSAAKDVVATSIRLDTPFGMTIALASIFAGAGYRFIGPSSAKWPTEGSPDTVSELKLLTDSKADEPVPTILFVSKEYHETIVKALYNSFKGSTLANLVAKYKLIGIQGGDVSRKGWWENLVWRPIRQRALGGIAGDKLRSLVVVGDAPSAASLSLSHLLLSFPISRIQSSPFSSGPIFASHYYDLQSRIPSALTPDFTGPQASVGPPANNVEVVLKGDKVESGYETNDNIHGEVWARGPAILGASAVENGWVDMGVDAAVQTNGAFVFG